ncbi:MAG TPA: pectin acetylesterase-family hydrolase [Polyangiaceae bacterium]|nr:pectin acetylesterase-family hydrolase [Polyangiaceae bacterium]
MAIAACAIAPILANCTSSPTTSEPGRGSTGSSGSSGGLGSGGLGSSGSNSSSGGSTSGAGSSSSSGSPGDDVSPTGDAGGIVLTADGAPAACAANDMYAQASFVSLAVAPGTALVKGQGDAIPGSAAIATPAGWDFHQGGLCRDGSPAGFYVHFSASNSDKLFIYLEGGGACDSATFCTHNPANIEQVFAGGAASQGQTIAGSLSFTNNGQVPYTPSSGYSPGIFDFTNTANPLKDWNAVYVPYCNGDVHFGTLDDVDIPSDGVVADLPHQHFVGGLNLKSYIARIVPTFPNMSQVVLTGASAGAFGAGLNYGMVQDSFGLKTPVVVLEDSGPSFSVTYEPGCVQKKWRTIWGLDAGLPSDCAECTMSDGSGLSNLQFYWLHKYPNARLGLVTTMEDEVIRLFYAQGENSCASDNATALTLSQALCGGYTCAKYTAGINDLVSTLSCTGRFAAYLIGGMNANYMNPTYHQHIFRDEFYQAITNDGSITMAKWTADFLSGKGEIVGP